MKIIWHSNAPWAGSGYGQQTDLFTRLLVEDGHDVKISTFYGLQGKSLKLGEKLEVLPIGFVGYGGDVINPHWQAYKPDVFVGLIDLWVFEKEELAKYPNAWWVPIDCDPIPPKVAEKLQYIKHPWAMSKFGEAKMREIGIEPRYVPHGIDTEVFKPIDRDKARQALGIPEKAFLFSTVAANKGNPSRKNLPQMLKAFARLCREQDDVYFFVHTNTLNVHDGLDLQRVVEFYGIPDDRIIFPSVYELQMGKIDPQYLNIIYNASDAFILPSAGEGFGVPVIEAQAAGCPVIVSDFTAQSELCGSGMKIPVDWEDTIIGLHYSEQAFVLSLKKIYEAMCTAYATWKASPFLRTKARDFAMQYDYKTVYEKYMKPAIEVAYNWNTAHKANSASKYASLGYDYHWQGEWQNPKGHYRKWVDFQLAYLPADGTGKTVLDFGCGDGYPASLLAERGYSVFGVENVEGARKVAEEKVPSGQFFSSIGAIPPDVEFDYVVALDVIEHVETNADLDQLIEVIKDAKAFSLISTPPPGIDAHAVRGFTINDIKMLFPSMRMDVLEMSKVDQLVKISQKSAYKDVPGKFKIAVLSDCRVPTVGDGAHGLGNSAYEIASGLADRGHDVTLLAGPGSRFDKGKIAFYADEVTRAQMLAKNLPEFDVYIDTGHHHLLSKMQPDWNIINRMGDGECDYSPPNKVVMTDFLKRRYGGGRLIKTGIKTDVIPARNGTPPQEHVLFFGRVHKLKGVETAIEAARLAGVEIKFVGPNQSSLAIETEELTGKAKWDAIHQAKAVLLPGGEDFAPRTPLEVAAAGVPVLTMPYDGTGEHVADGITGFVCADVETMAQKISDVGSIDGEKARRWVETTHNYDTMIDAYIKACEDVYTGERW